MFIAPDIPKCDELLRIREWWIPTIQWSFPILQLKFSQFFSPPRSIVLFVWKSLFVMVDKCFCLFFFCVFFPICSLVADYIHPKGYKNDETTSFTLYLAINYGDSVLAARIISSGKVQDFGCALNSRGLILLSVFKMVGLKIKRCPLYGLPWLKLLLSRYYCTEVHKSMFKIGKKLPWS